MWQKAGEWFIRTTGIRDLRRLLTLGFMSTASLWARAIPALWPRRVQGFQEVCEAFQIVPETARAAARGLIIRAAVFFLYAVIGSAELSYAIATAAGAAWWVGGIALFASGLLVCSRLIPQARVLLKGAPRPRAD